MQYDHDHDSRPPIPRLQQHTAGPGEFIRIVTKDGEKQVRQGPVMVWEDPLVHDEIKVWKAITVNAKEAMVVYEQKENEITRKIIRGPVQHIPTKNEWIHQFCWHGADPNAPVGIARKKPSQLKFSKLMLIPDQMYYDVEGVRTADDALVTIKLMAFFQLEDVETMLDGTHDPVSELVNAMSADIISKIGTLAFEEFKAVCGQFNEMSSYAQLVTRAEQIGYKITKIVFRGYTSSDKLQGMHDESIETRTGLKLQQETESTAQDLADFKLRKVGAREQQKRELDRAAQEHEVRMEADRLQATLKNQWQEKAQERRLRERVTAQAVQAKKIEQRLEEEHLSKLRNLGLDLTSFFVAKEQRGNVKIVKIHGAGGKTPMHLHDTS